MSLLILGDKVLLEACDALSHHATTFIIIGLATGIGLNFTFVSCLCHIANARFLFMLEAVITSICIHSIHFVFSTGGRALTPW